MLADPATPAHVDAGLRRVEEIRRFGHEQVGLRDAADSYTRYFDTGGQPVAWNVSASPPDRFEPFQWWFPIVGRLPYKGYFTAHRARAERDRLRDAGYDAIHRPVSAYSTLGYLGDPVLSTMLDDSEARLAELILHELTHATVFADGHTDYNESVATFVGRAGALAYLVQRYGADAAEVAETVQQRAEAARFTQFLRGVVDRLDSLYESGARREQILERRQHIFAQEKERFRALRTQFTAGRYDGFLDWELNNARLLSYRRYHSRQETFAAVLDRRTGDLREAVSLFAECAGHDDPWTCVGALPGATVDASPER